METLFHQNKKQKRTYIITLCTLQELLLGLLLIIWMLMIWVLFHMFSEGPRCISFYPESTNRALKRKQLQLIKHYICSKLTVPFGKRTLILSFAGRLGVFGFRVDLASCWLWRASSSRSSASSRRTCFTLAMVSRTVSKGSATTVFSSGEGFLLEIYVYCIKFPNWKLIKNLFFEPLSSRSQLSRLVLWSLMLCTLFGTASRFW